MKVPRPLWWAVAGAAAVLAANGTLVYVAVSSWTGLETQQHFARGLRYNQNLEGVRRQEALGWTASLATDFETSSVAATFRDRHGNPLTDLQVRLLTTRPTHDGHDRDFKLKHLGAGRYTGKFDLPLRGQWDFRLLARRGDDVFQHLERIVTP